jgi:hypothetical protein
MSSQLFICEHLHRYHFMKRLHASLAGPGENAGGNATSQSKLAAIQAGKDNLLKTF